MASVCQIKKPISKSTVMVIPTLFLILSPATGFAEQCSNKFTFPSLNGRVFKAEENSDISLTFGVSSSTCALPDNFVITVTKMNEDHMLYPVCRMKIKNGKCPQVAGNICSCDEQPGMYQLHKVVEQSDNTTWTFQTDNGITAEVVFVISSMQRQGRPTSTTDRNNGDIQDTRNDNPTTTSLTGPVALMTTGTRSTDKTDKDPETKEEESYSQPGPGVYVLGAIGIVAFAVAVVIITVCAMTRGRRNHGPEPEITDRVNPQNEEEIQAQVHEEAPSYHVYWAIPDDHSADEPSVSFGDRAPERHGQEETAPGEYLIPLPSPSTM